MHGCTGTTRKGGPCGAWPLKGRDVCLAHADAATRESVGFIAANGFGGRPANPRAVDVLRERIEANIDGVLKPLFDALGAAGGFTVKYVAGGEEKVEFIPEPDHAIRLQAVRELLDRAYGKPKQATEVSGPDGGPIATQAIDIPDTDAYRRRVAAIAAQALGYAETATHANGGNGNGSHG